MEVDLVFSQSQDFAFVSCGLLALQCDMTHMEPCLQLQCLNSNLAYLGH